MGKISRRPTSMAMESTTLLREEKAAKLPKGPTASRPGPVLLMQARAAEQEVVREKPSRLTTKQVPPEDQEEAGEEDKDGVQGLLIHRLAVQLDHLHRPGMGEPAEGAAGAAEQQQHPGGFETAGGAAGASAQEHQQHQDKLGDGGTRGPKSAVENACGGDH